MSEINYVQGDATSPQAEGPKIICHVCNDIGAWGRGFVLSLSRQWKNPELEYRKLKAYVLGEVQFVQAEEDIWVANMIAQHSIGMANGPPIRYPALTQCLAKVAAKAKELGASVHMPLIGCGLAGGKWERVEPLIEEHLCGAGVEVTVYNFGN